MHHSSLQQPEYNKSVKSLRGRCNVVTVVFVAMMVVSALATLSDLAFLQFLQEISSGEAADDARAEAIDARQALFGILQFGLFLTCAFVFLRWFYLSHKNLKAGGLDELQYTPAWAVGGFLVPFINLVLPFRVMKEVWKGSAFLSGDVDSESWRMVSPAPHVGWWWFSFLVTSILGRLSGRMMLRAGDVGEYLNAGWMTLASDVVAIPAALVAVLLVRCVTSLQEKARMNLQFHETDLAHNKPIQTDDPSGRL